MFVISVFTPEKGERFHQCLVRGPYLDSSMKHKSFNTQLLCSLTVAKVVLLCISGSEESAEPPKRSGIET